MSFSKQQVEFLKRAFDELIGEREFVETSWYGYKEHSHPLEIQILKFEGGLKFFEYEHAPGSYGFNIGTSYGVTGNPDDFAHISIDADKQTIHFQYDAAIASRVYRAFKPIETEEDKSTSEQWHKWREMQRESWKILQTIKPKEQAS